MAGNELMTGTETLLRELLSIVAELRTEIKNDRENINLVVKNIEQLAGKVDAINVKLESHIAGQDGRDYLHRSECEKVFLRIDNFDNEHDRAHKNNLESTTMKQTAALNLWKIIAIIAGAGFIWSIIVPAIH